MVWASAPTRHQDAKDSGLASSIGGPWGELPTGILVAAVLYGINALLLLLLGGVQFLLALVAAGSSAPDSALSSLFGSGWNVLVGGFFCVVAYWILRLRPAGYSWGLCSAVLNAVLVPILMVINLASGAYLVFLVQLIGFPLDVASALLLYTNRAHFPRAGVSPAKRLP